jgi:hypothetical protein
LIIVHLRRAGAHRWRRLLLVTLAPRILQLKVWVIIFVRRILLGTNFLISSGLHRRLLLDDLLGTQHELILFVFLWRNIDGLGAAFRALLSRNN